MKSKLIKKLLIQLIVIAVTFSSMTILEMFGSDVYALDECGSTEVDKNGVIIHEKNCSNSAVASSSTEIRMSGTTMLGFNESWLNSLTATQKQNIYVDVPNTVTTITNGSSGDGGFNQKKIGGSTIIPGMADTRFIDIDLSNATELVEIGQYAASATQGAQLHGKIIFPTTANSKLKRIADLAFYRMFYLKGDLIIPDTVEYIGYSAFERAGEGGKLGNLHLPNNAKYTTVKYQSFYQSMFSGSLIIPENITTIETYGFGESVFTTVKIHDGLKVLAGSALKVKNTIPTPIEIPQNIESIGYHSFWDLIPDNSAITLPASLNTLASEAFFQTKLVTIYIERENIQWGVETKEGFYSLKYAYHGFQERTKISTVLKNQTAYNEYQAVAKTDWYSSLATYKCGVDFVYKDGTKQTRDDCYFNKPFNFAEKTNSNGDVYIASDSNYSFPQVKVIVPTGFEGAWLYTGDLAKSNLEVLKVLESAIIKETVLNETYTLEPIVLESPYVASYCILQKSSGLGADVDGVSRYTHTLPIDNKYTDTPNTIQLLYSWRRPNRTFSHYGSVLPQEKIVTDNLLDSQYYYLQINKAWYIDDKGVKTEFIPVTKYKTGTNTAGQMVYTSIVDDSYEVKFHENYLQNGVENTYTQRGTVDKGCIGFNVIPKRLYYKFLGWNTVADGSAHEFLANTSVISDISVYAQWEFVGNKYEVISSLETSGGSINNIGSIQKNQGDPYEIILTPNSGYRVKSLLVNNIEKKSEIVNNKYIIKDLQENYEIKVSYELIPHHTVTFDSDGGEPVSSIEVYEGAAYGTLSEPKKTDFEFKGWYTEKEGQGTKIEETTLFTLTAPQKLYAKWEPIVSHTVSFSEDKMNINRVYRLGVNEKDESNSKKSTILMTNKGINIDTDFTLLKWEVENIAGFESYGSVCQVDNTTGVITGLKSGVAKVTVKLKDGYDVLDTGTYDSIIVIVPGDINKDGVITSNDTLITNRVSASLGSIEDFVDISDKTYLTELADMNGDGKVTSMDVVALKRMTAGIDSPSN